MSDETPYTPDRLRALAGKAYRLGGSFQVAELREIGNYLARAAAAADEQGDLLQQHAAAKAELARLEQAVAEADAARIDRDRARKERDDARAEAHRWRGSALSIKGERDALREELDGQRLWYWLAVEWVRELRPMIPADKQTLIDPMQAARVGRDYRDLLATAIPLLRQLRVWASLHAQHANDAAATGDVAMADAFLEADACRKFSRPTKSST
jgi:hypothetical protein